MKRIIMLAGVLAFLLTCSPAVWAQGQTPGSKTPPKATSGYVQETTIIGTISREADGYVIVGRYPREVYFVNNHNPPVLDKLAQSGQTVRIKARIVMDGTVDIETINGKPYEEAEKGKPEKK